MKKIILLSLMVWLFSLNFVHAQLPSVNLKTMDGQSVNTDTLSNDGKPFIIDFFATWCKPCNRELDAIAEVYEDWQKETGVKIVAVSIDQAQNINKVKPSLKTMVGSMRCCSTPTAISSAPWASK